MPGNFKYHYPKNSLWPCHTESTLQGAVVLLLSFWKTKNKWDRAKQLASITEQRQGKGWEDGWTSQCPVWLVWHYDILQSKDLLCYFRSESQRCHSLITFPWCRKRLCIALIFHKGPCVHLYCIKLPQNIETSAVQRGFEEIMAQTHFVRVLLGAQASAWGHCLNELAN